MTPAVVSVVRDALRKMPARLADYDYDEENECEKLLGGISQTGERLQELAPDLRPVLLQDKTPVAALAVIGINAQILVPDLEKLYGAASALPMSGMDGKKDCAVIYSRALFAYSTWYLGAPDERFDEAMALAKTDYILHLRAQQWWNVPGPSQRLVGALQRLAEDEFWLDAVLAVFAEFGPPAACAVAAMAEPDIAGESYILYVKACHACGVFDLPAARDAVERKLAFHHWNVVEKNASGAVKLSGSLVEAWQLYFTLDPNPRRVRAALAALKYRRAEGYAERVLETLVAPEHGLRFLPDLLRHKHHSLVYGLWLYCADKTVFWKALKSRSGAWSWRRFFGKD